MKKALVDILGKTWIVKIAAVKWKINYVGGG